MASMTKLFTGLAIGQLVEQGNLSYDDPLSKFLPDFPDAENATKIRIKHLLSHTAGLGDGLPPLENPDWHDARTTVKALVDGFERKPPAFEPGTRWAYSNMSFVLLGRVIELVTGKDYYDYMQENVFGPAGAKSASFPMLPGNGVAVVPMHIRTNRHGISRTIENISRTTLGSTAAAADRRVARSCRRSIFSSSPMRCARGGS